MIAGSLLLSNLTMMIEVNAGPEIAGKLCPYCQNRIAAGISIALCPGCKTPHHAECWQHNGGCATFGCRFAPGASGDFNTDRSGAVSDDDLGIVLHPGASAGSTFGGQQQPYCGAVPPAAVLPSSQATRPASWLWAALAAAVLVVLVGSAVKMHHSPSPALEHLRQADQRIRDGDFEAAKEECARAISVDPGCIGAYYRKGLLLLGLGEEDSKDRLSELIDRATRGETSDLDAADECFKQCIQKGAYSSDGNSDGTGLTKSDIIAQSNLNLALTATLRVLANEASQHPDYARQWADTARQYIRQAKRCQLDYRESRFAETMESLLCQVGY